MRQTLLLLGGALLLSFASCQENKDEVMETLPKKDSINVEERNKAIVKESFEAMEKGDVNGVMKNAAPDFRDYGDGSMGSMGLDSSKAMMSEWLGSLTDYKIENEEYYADGNKVLVYADYSGTWTKDMMGMKASGKAFKTKDVDIFTLNDEGKVTEHRNVQNWGAVMGMPAGAPPAAEEKKK
jgi:ketosteroid isomerase-like protein